MESSFKITQEEEIKERNRNTKKLILIDTLDDLGLNPKRKKEFIKFYYTKLDDLGIEEALAEFKKLKS